MLGAQISAAATQLNAGWKRLGSNLPFLGRSPGSSETDSPRPSASSAAPSATMGSASATVHPETANVQSAKSRFARFWRCKRESACVPFLFFTCLKEGLDPFQDQSCLAV